MTTIKILVCAILALALTAAFRPLSAQSPARVRIALVDSLSTPDVRAEVVRYGPTTEPALILLRRGDERTEDLISALAVLRSDQRAAQRPPGVISRITVAGHTDVRSVPRAVRDRAARMLSQVRSAPPSRIGNLGRGYWAEFELER